MAHFAKIENNLVTQVIVVDNNDILDNQGNESEIIGAQFCTDLLGGNWVQTSYSRTFRKHYAGLGYTYDENRDAFIPEQPYPSWLLNEDTCYWEPPVPHPTIEEGSTDRYTWDEGSLSWVLTPTD